MKKTLFVHTQSLVDWNVVMDGRRVARIENISGYKRTGLYGVHFYGIGETYPDGSKYDYKIVRNYRESINAVKAAFGVDSPVSKWPGGYYER